MRVTIVPADGVVVVDAVGYASLDLSASPPGVHAVQWKDTSGVVELVDENGSPLPSTVINDLDDWQFALDAWQAAHTTATTPPPPLTLEQQRASALLGIDADVDSITAQVIGNRGVEYIEAEAQALAYQTAGYTGPVPSMVQSWVNAKAIEGVTWTSTQAANDILGTAAAWRGAVDAIRTNRLNAKAYVRVAANDTDLSVAMSNWAGFVAAVRSQLGI